MKKINVFWACCLIVVLSLVLFSCEAQEPQEPHEHEWILEYTLDPTCTNNGMIIYRCSCGEYKYVNPPPLGHDYISHEDVPPTCTESGRREYKTCSRCDYSNFTIVEALGHKSQLANDSQGHWHVCSTCGETLDDVSPHSFKYGVCTVCGFGTVDYSEIFYISQSGTLTLKAWEDLPEVLEIPETINGVTVVEIGAGTFNNCTTIKKIVIPKTVTTMHINSFEKCTCEVEFAAGMERIPNEALRSAEKISKVTIPASVVEIGDYAFQSCAIKSISFPDGLQRIGDMAIEGCENLVTVTIPASVSQIGHAIFMNCTKLKSIKVAEGNEYFKDVGGVLFNITGTVLIAYPDGLAGSYVVPSGTVEIGNAAFSHSIVSSITLPDTVKTLGTQAFAFCSNLPGIELPDGLESIGVWCFQHCSSIESIDIPDSVSDIQHSAFSGCSNLKTASLPKEIDTIVSCMFQGCDLRFISLPKTVTSIGSRAFESNKQLSVLDFEGTVSEWNSISKYSTWKDGSTALKTVSCKDGVVTL